jgi:sulfur carrier protein
MKIIVNGDAREVAAMTLAGILEELGYRSSIIATAVNGQFIARGDRPERAMTDGDRLEIVAPMQGG